MTTKHLQIATSIVNTLKVGGIAGGRIFAARTRAISQESPSGVVVRLARSSSSAASVMGGPTNWRTLIEVECYGRLAGGTPDAAADQTVEDVMAALAVNPTLSGLVQDIMPLEGDTLSWDYDELDTSLACITVKFIVSHQTTARTLT